MEIFDAPLSDEAFKEHNVKNKILSAPVRYHLVDVLKALKFGRPTDNQYLLDDMIEMAQDDLPMGTDVWIFCNWGLCKAHISERVSPTIVQGRLIHSQNLLYRVVVEFDKKPDDYVKHNFHYTREQVYLTPEEAIASEGKAGQLMVSFGSYLLSKYGVNTTNKKGEPIGPREVSGADISGWQESLKEESSDERE